MHDIDDDPGQPDAQGIGQAAEPGALQSVEPAVRRMAADQDHRGTLAAHPLDHRVDHAVRTDAGGRRPQAFRQLQRLQGMLRSGAYRVRRTRRLDADGSPRGCAGCHEFGRVAHQRLGLRVVAHPDHQVPGA